MKRTGKLKSLDWIKNAKMTVTVVNERFVGDVRPATAEDLAPLREARAAMLRGDLVVNGRRVTPDGVWTDEVVK